MASFLKRLLTGTILMQIFRSICLGFAYTRPDKQDMRA